MEYWLQGMPFTTITQKMNSQILILINLVESYPKIFVGKFQLFPSVFNLVENDKIFQQTFSILTKSFKAKWSNITSNESIKALISKFNSVDSLRRKLFSVTNNMNDYERAKIMTLMN